VSAKILISAKSRETKQDPNSSGTPGVDKDSTHVGVIHASARSNGDMSHHRQPSFPKAHQGEAQDECKTEKIPERTSIVDSHASTRDQVSAHTAAKTSTGTAKLGLKSESANTGNSLNDGILKSSGSESGSFVVAKESSAKPILKDDNNPQSAIANKLGVSYVQNSI
jgi:hypothetical protein